MTAIKKLMLAFTLLSATAGAQASEGALAEFGREKTRKPSSLIQHVSVANAASQDSPWGQPLGAAVAQPGYRVGYAHLSGRFNGIKLRPQDLQGRYDVPLSDS